MKRIITWLIVSLVCFQGCAQNKPFVRKDIASLAPLKIVRYETPEIRRITSTGETIGILSALDITGITALVAGVPYIASGKDFVKGSLPDFGKLVTDKFVARASMEIPSWPATTVREEPIKKIAAQLPPRERYQQQKKLRQIESNATSISSGTLLVFEVALAIHHEQGFVSGILATMKDSKGNIIWQQKFIYMSKNYGRKVSIDKYESDNYRFLREEIDFAAEKTVSIFIEHFKGPKWSSLKKADS
jgi:hypothetical protein